MSVDNLNMPVSAAHLEVVAGAEPVTTDRPTEGAGPARTFSTVLSQATTIEKAKIMATRKSLSATRRVARKSDIIVPSLTLANASTPASPPSASPPSASHVPLDAVAASSTQARSEGSAMAAVASATSVLTSPATGTPTSRANEGARQMTMDMVLIAFGALSRGIGVRAETTDDVHGDATSDASHTLTRGDAPVATQGNSPLGVEAPLVTDAPASTLEEEATQLTASRAPHVATTETSLVATSPRPLVTLAPTPTSLTAAPQPSSTWTSDPTPHPSREVAGYDARLGDAARDVVGSTSSSAASTPVASAHESTTPPSDAAAAQTAPPSPILTKVASVVTASSSGASALDVDELSRAISRPLEGGDGTYSVTVSMHPNDLGHVQAVVTLSGSDLRVALSPQTSAGHAALATALEGLKGELSRDGATVTVSVGHPGADDGSGQRRAHDQTPGTLATSDDETASESSPVLVDESSALIHLVL